MKGKGEQILAFLLSMVLAFQTISVMALAVEECAHGDISLVQQAQEGYVNPYLRSSDVCIGTSAQNPFKIGNPTILAELAELVNAGETYGVYAYGDAYYELVADIDLDDMDWTPIGTADCTFNGGFAGHDFVIVSAQLCALVHPTAGLFGYVTDENSIDVTLLAPTPVEEDAIRNDNDPTDDTVWDGTIGTGFYDGTGTSTDPYLVTTGAELAYLAK